MKINVKLLNENQKYSYVFLQALAYIKENENENLLHFKKLFIFAIALIQYVCQHCCCKLE